MVLAGLWIRGSRFGMTASLLGSLALNAVGGVHDGMARGGQFGSCHCGVAREHSVTIPKGAHELRGSVRSHSGGSELGAQKAEVAAMLGFELKGN
jgi:hypothetical protein